eukprot:TRINITY_DN10993_c0_g1_i2.p1 TRINITY_DN10993_c0_g1~~TRINITY_DN10993_c0_g1_i2.p1  ORF type:complete len:350 (+),score=47.54 TRINITY_DN10993_c0_g1_i2:435-1484(+)
MCGGIQTVCERAKENVELARVTTRHISKRAERILDAPGLVDDYYLNPLDWGYENSLLICLGSGLYLYEVSTGKAKVLMNYSKGYLTSVGWSSTGSTLAVGTSDNIVLLWDAAAGKEVATAKFHHARVTSLSWNPVERSILSTAGKDGSIHNLDTRATTHPIFSFPFAHQQEICGLRWAPEGAKLASGGNDDAFCVWEVGRAEPVWRCVAHSAAVKALAWAEWKRGTLATGGGTDDKTIRVWDTCNRECEEVVKVNSQVSSLQFNKKYKEVVSSHGFHENQITVWSYPHMKKIADLKGHKGRILSTVFSPDGSTLASVGADETLRLWKINEVENESERVVSKSMWISCLR